MNHQQTLLLVLLCAFLALSVVVTSSHAPEKAHATENAHAKLAFDPESPRFLQRKEALAREAAKLRKPVPMASPYNVTYDGRSMMIDGERKLFISGSVHYPRSSVGMWDGLLRQSKAAGIDIIETYVFWNLHEPVKGQLYFEDNADLMTFLELCQQHDLYVHLRIGPYACAEWNYGGFPIWLKEEEGIVFRDNNAPFMEEMAAWMATVVEIVRPMFASNGGPIILAQVENEYGWLEHQYGLNGTIYANWSISYALSLDVGVPWNMCAQDNEPAAINTCNGFYCDMWLAQHFETFPDQPALWTENWGGWFQLWQEPKPTRPAEEQAYAILRWFAQGGSHMNYYMWQGGTNFDRWVGGPFIITSYDYDVPLDEYGLPNEPKFSHLSALHDVLHQYSNPILYSPIAQGANASDDGSLKVYVYSNSTTTVNFLINWSQVNGETSNNNQYLSNNYYLLPWSACVIVNDQSGEYVVYNSSDVFGMSLTAKNQRSVISVSAPPTTILYWPEPLAGSENQSIINETPLKQLGVTHDLTDYLWYITNVTTDCQSGCQLDFSNVGGVTHLFVDGQYQSYVFGSGGSQSISFSSNSVPPYPIQILNSGMGLLNYGEHMELWDLGIMGAVSLTDSSDNQVNLTNNQWEMKAGLLGENLGLSNSSDSSNWGPNWKDGVNQSLSWFSTYLSLPEYTSTSVFALDLTGLNKGFLWVNGRGIGRYWLIEGVSPSCSGCILTEDYQPNNCRIACGLPSQRYYHIPADWLSSSNYVVVFEEIGGDPSQMQIVAFDSSNSTTDGSVECGFADEDDTIGILCPPGAVITEVQEAFFGNPANDQCGSLQPGSCNSNNSVSVVGDACLGRSYCFVDASIDVFGDPCPYTHKSLSVQLLCS